MSQTAVGKTQNHAPSGRAEGKVSPTLEGRKERLNSAIDDAVTRFLGSAHVRAILNGPILVRDGQKIACNLRVLAMNSRRNFMEIQGTKYPEFDGAIVRLVHAFALGDGRNIRVDFDVPCSGNIRRTRCDSSRVYSISGLEAILAASHLTGSISPLGNSS